MDAPNTGSQSGEGIKSFCLKKIIMKKIVYHTVIVYSDSNHKEKCFTCQGCNLVEEQFYKRRDILSCEERCSITTECLGHCPFIYPFSEEEYIFLEKVWAAIKFEVLFLYYEKRTIYTDVVYCNRLLSICADTIVWLSDSFRTSTGIKSLDLSFPLLSKRLYTLRHFSHPTEFLFSSSEKSRQLASLVINHPTLRRKLEDKLGFSLRKVVEGDSTYSIVKCLPRKRIRL